MLKRFTVFGLIVLATYFAFGDQFLASNTSTPESFITGVGRGVGDAISGIATQIGQMIWS